MNSQKVEFAKQIAHNLNDLKYKKENEKLFEETPFGRRQGKQGDQQSNMITDKEFETQVLEILSRTTVHNQIELSQLEKKLQISEDLAVQVKSGDGCFMTIYNDDPVREFEQKRP